MEQGPPGAAAAQRCVRLGEEEVALLRLIAGGLSLAAVGRRQGLSERTVRRHLQKVLERVGARTPIEAVVWAVRRGLV